MRMKEKYKFNHDLFRILPKLRNKTSRELMAEAGHSIGLYNDTIKNNDIRINLLIDVCNAAKIDVRVFFLCGIVVPDSSATFIPLRFSNSAIGELFRGLVPDLTKTRFSEEMGVSLSKVYIWLDPGKCKIKASEMLDICNRYNVPPSFFFERA